MNARTIALVVAAALATAPAAYAGGKADYEKGSYAPAVAPLPAGAVEKAASAGGLGSRATASPTATVYGSFTILQQTTVYILVRGNSLGTLGVTSNFLDFPRLRLFDAAGEDLVFDNAGRPGFNRCVSTTDQAVINFYASRGQPVNSDDACIGAVFAAGTYTFSIVPTAVGGVNSSPSTGEILFETTLGP